MGMTNEDWKRAYNALKSEHEQLKLAYYALKNAAKPPKFRILGYGAGNEPFSKGVEMSATENRGYAEDICNCLKHRHIGQWFGYSYTDENGNVEYSAIQRIGNESVVY